jgi:hypothetical protein
MSAEEQEKVELYRSRLYTTQEEVDPVTHRYRQVRVPTPMRKAYEAARQAYQEAAQRYSALRLNANTSSDPRAVLDFAQNAPLYRRQVQDALATWTSAGYKLEVEMMEAYIAQVTGHAPDH